MFSILILAFIATEDAKRRKGDKEGEEEKAEVATYVHRVTLVDADKRARELTINNNRRTIEAIRSQNRVYYVPVIVDCPCTADSSDSEKRK